MAHNFKMTDKFRHWSFTVNNYTDDDIAKVRSLGQRSGTKYLLYGKEVGESGTPHLQGHVSFSSQRHAASLHKLFQGHWTVVRDVGKSIDYCKKDGDFEEFGVNPLGLPKKQGKRNDLEAIRDAINEGQTCRKKLRQDFPSVCAKYPNFVSQLILDTLPAPEQETFPLREWQSELISDLRLPPNERTIVFCVDVVGNAGKTWFTRYYESVYGRSICIPPGKKADMVFAFMSLLKSDTKVIFVDAPRSKQGEFIQYDFLEELKNGRVLNTKYESRVIEFQLCHVVVMMNEIPNLTALSKDRYQINYL